MAGMPNYTQTLAHWIAGNRFEAIPAEVTERLKWLVLDSLGCAIFGTILPWSKMAIAAITAIDNTNRATIWGTDLRSSCPHAALLNGTLVQSNELDDLHITGYQHSGATVIPAALAVAEDRGGFNGRQLLAAMVCGYETVIRVGQCLGSEHVLRGWHPAGTNSPFGSVATVGNLIGLDEEKMLNALGLAGNRGAGLEASRVAAMDKRMNEGRGSMSGMHSALLAEKGFTGAANIFEVEKGFCRTFTQSKDKFDLSKITSELGQRFDILTVGLKIYAANALTHTAIQAAKEIREQHNLKHEDIAKVTVRVGKLLYDHTNVRYRPESETYAQFCIPYVVAVMLIEGDAFVDQFTADKVKDPAIADLANRVELVHDPSIDTLDHVSQRQSRLKVTLRDGRTIEHTVVYRPGDPDRPVTTQEIIHKFKLLAGKVMPPSQVDRIIDLMGGLDKAKDVSRLAKALAVPQA